MRIGSTVLVVAAAVATAVTVEGVRGGLPGATPGPDGREERRSAPAASPAGAGRGPTHGMSIPTTHPRLWFDAARLARAREWFRKHPFTPRKDDHLGEATRGLLAAEPARCRAAIAWALAATKDIRTSGVACDQCRWSGEDILLTYDWCHAHLTPQERADFIAATNAWIDHWRVQEWGSPPMHLSNYYWGYLRNELEWAIASYEDNAAMAEKLLDDVFTRRLGGDFNRAATSTDGRGGVGPEGSQYGPYVTFYATAPFVTAGLLGRDVLTETGFWREAVYAQIYSTTPAPTARGDGGGHTSFPFSDDEQWPYTDLRDPEGARTKANFMTAAAMRWSGSRVGRHARQWLKETGAAADRHVRAVDPGGDALPYDDLPLDYYAPGPRFLWARSAWGPGATALMLQLGEGGGPGHSHVDWGTWQLWRNGRFLSRETVSYSNDVAGYAGKGMVGAALAHGHNAILFDGAGLRGNPWSAGEAVVTRLESRPEFARAAVDLTRTARGKEGNAQVVHAEREFVFVRALETLVVLDRLESRGAGATKTFLAHCETRPDVSANRATCTNGSQALLMTTLLPASRSVRVVEEGGKVGQFRIEVDTSPGTARSYILTVLQGKDARAPDLTPSVTENGDSFTVALDGATRVTFAKGMSAAEGSLTAGGRTTRFADGVQETAVGDDGPVWR